MSTLAGAVNQVGSTDGLGAAARFNVPLGVAADGAGALYVADTGSCTIRKVGLATGGVSTLAGTASTQGSADSRGAAAQFNSPYAVAADGVGNGSRTI